ncbi:glycoside hydrolase family 13 protein [Streptomyces sp. NPDC029003]|uniref:glycoside hydrolase family 13 protein n=1 Tax=Streptomyces sp. NPDC029003 TaxID=3155125 RepID=UPI0033F1E055
MHATRSPRQPRGWWWHAVVYQVYPRSFADGDGDGTGDLAGLRARLPHLAALGVDALWITPWYRSPMADGGYDVADYRDIDPAFGTLAEAELLIAEARALDLAVVVDIVPNHLSVRHPWFRAALAAPAGSPERDRFHFRPGRGESGELPPNDWRSEFGGPAWTRTTDADGKPGEWYLHLFTPDQPDLDWNHPAVRAEFESVLRFWFDRGVAGIRVDSANLLAKDPALPDLATVASGAPHPYVDREELHDIYRAWRRIAASYPDERVLIGEIWIRDAARLARYLRPDELHAAFNFAFLGSPWEAARMRETIDASLAAGGLAAAPASWVLCNHDVTRTVTRYGRADTSFDFAAVAAGIPTDLALGTRRARAAALLTLALPGSVYLYQGEELGLPEVEDLPPQARRDPVHFRSHGENPGRDGCRVPLPWSGQAPPFGFGPPGTLPWLPQPGNWAPYTVEAQEADPASPLWLYRRAVGLRRSLAAFRDGAFRWVEAGEDVLAFRRGDALLCVVNFSGRPVPLPAGHTVLISSEPSGGDTLAAHAAVWLTPSPPAGPGRPRGNTSTDGNPW